MNYQLWIAFTVAMVVFYSETERHRVQVAELRAMMECRLQILFDSLAEARVTLKWIEPQLKVPAFKSYHSASIAGLKSLEEVMAAVNSGRYPSALVPMTEYIPVPTGSPS